MRVFITVALLYIGAVIGAEVTRTYWLAYYLGYGILLAMLLGCIFYLWWEKVIAICRGGE